jgi:mannonate dehydratase
MPGITRRQALATSTAGIVLASSGASGQTKSGLPAGPRQEDATTPKLCFECGPGPLAAGPATDAGMRRIKQLGIDHVIGTAGPMPWTVDRLTAMIAEFKHGGLSLGNCMIGGFPKTIYGKPGRDEEIAKVIESVRAAGQAGLPVVEYNFYAHRIVEGYYEELGRAGAGLTAFDHDKVKDLPPLPEEGAHTLDEMWTNITYFLKAVIPEAEKAGVRMALHPNDPPAPISRGSQQIMATIEGWKKLIAIVDSPSNGITFDCGVTREMGGDPVATCRYFGERDRINHVHFRNVKVREPYERYTEVFIDEGENDMFAVMRELIAVNYTRLVYPEHPRALDYDREHPGFRTYYPGGGSYSGFAFNAGFARAMMQAALASKRG